MIGTRVADNRQLERRDGTEVGECYICCIFRLITFFPINLSPTRRHHLMNYTLTTGPANILSGDNTSTKFNEGSMVIAAVDRTK